MLLPLLGLTSCSEDYSNPPIINPGIHTGVWDDPMSCYQVLLGTSVEGYSSVWVTGYIVGCVNTGISNTCSANTADFSAPGPVNTNILMADTPDERDWTKCITVQLPSGPVRTALNITDASNKGKQVTILGTIGVKYCGVYGVKAVSAYVLGDKGDKSIDIIEKPVRPTIADWSFLNAANGFTYDQKTPATSTAEIWKVTEKYGWVASGYISGASIASESTLISPVIDLSNYASVTMNVHSAANKFNDQATFLAMTQVLAREEGAANWTVLTMPNAPEGTSWTFSDSGDIDLSAFDGKKIQVGFRYTSSTSVAGSWEIDALQIYGERK